MYRFTKLTFTLLILSLLLSLTGCGESDEEIKLSREAATMYVERGERSVGYTVLQAAEGDLEIKAWYPAEEKGLSDIQYPVTLKFPGFPTDPMAIVGVARMDAVPAMGAYPLVVLSHGFGLNPEWYPIAEHLASHGFVVLGPEHTESDWATDIVATTIARPSEISATIDLAETGILSGVIDVERVAVIGHSWGGYTALASAGARFDLEHLTTRCAGEGDPFISGMFCAPFVNAGDQMAALIGLEQAPEGLWPSLADPRVDSIIVVAGDAFLFGEDGLAEVTVPSMMIGGTGDTAAPWDWGTGQAFDAVSSDYRVLVELEGAEHFFPTTSCDNMPFMADMPEEFRGYICEDPAWQKSDSLDITHHLMTSFLMSTLTDSRDADAALEPSIYAEESAFDILTIK